MKNILGHDNESEILTVIARLRENRFNILSYNDTQISFEIVLRYYNTVPISNSYVQKIKYIIKCEFNKSGYKYNFKQINDIDDRELSIVDGHIIWGLLEEKIFAHN
jgi:hypothetical protein